MPPGGAAHRARRRDRPRLQMASEGPLPQDRSDDLLADDLRRDASGQGHRRGADSAFASVPGLLNRHDWRATGSTGSSRMLMWWWRTALTPTTNVYLDAEGRFVAIGMRSAE
jgi:hypothetical protein